MPQSTIGVGFIGAGPVTQAIHIPTLARLGGTFRVVTVMDVDPDVAQSVAARVQAGWTTDARAVLDDDRVDVVVICSPHRFHAEQAIAACRAGKRAVLCEKPLALSPDDAEAIARASDETGVPIVVGAMHLFDPAWVAIAAHWGDLADRAHTIRYSIVLPPNPRFEDFATEVLGRPAAVPRDRRDPQVAAQMVRDGVVGLAVHDLPLVRTFCPDFTDIEVRSAIVPDPSGYLIDLRVGDRAVQVAAVNTMGWQPDWTLDVIADDAALHIDFTPSYVQAGSATATLHVDGASRVFGPYPANGYEGEWRYLAALLHGEAAPPDPGAAIDDVRFMLSVADAASSVALRLALEEAAR